MDRSSISEGEMEEDSVAFSNDGWQKGVMEE